MSMNAAELDAKLKTYRLNKKEYERIQSLLGRNPKGVEWALFSALWSEHCSYKSSKIHLKNLFNRSSRVLQSFGENAGVIDLGEGERVAFKMESHNHPSFIEPYQGAATGVGGILRDVFTMGARPVALGNYLCFGDPKASRMQTLVDGVVRGIGGYGNSVGVPNITGQTEFHSTYNNNILVNAFALGLFRPGEKVFLSKAKGIGNFVVYVGAKTGRDGVHGASMASESFDENSASKRPTVQIGDPFFEKLLIESCLEVMKQDLVVSIQDMGAAGLTSSSFEMASKGGVGFIIDLSKVPLRDSSLTPEDILLSESQERMLLMCEPSKFEPLKKVFNHWNLDASVIGEVVEKKTVTLKWKGEILTEIDPDILVEEAPQYTREFHSWKMQNRVTCDGEIELEIKDVKSTLLECLSSVHGSARNWIYDQYDQRVGARTVQDCSSDIGFIRLPDSGRGLSVVLGCRPYVMRFDAQAGGADSVAFPAIELAIKGFEPVGVTDCLNFGNPEKPEIMSQFVASLQAMSQQCEALSTPIISGNVSFYNETDNTNITSTPSTGVVGIRKAGKNTGPSDKIKIENSNIYVISLPQMTTGGVLQEIKFKKITGWGHLKHDDIAQFVTLLRELTTATSGSEHTIVNASKAVGKFGLGYTLARMCDKVGLDISSDAFEKYFPVPRDLFLERFYEVVVAVKQDKSKEFEKLFAEKSKSMGSKVLLIPIGKTQNEAALSIGKTKIGFKELFENYKKGWEAHFGYITS